MKRTVATTFAAALIGATVFVAPAHADDPAPADPCATLQHSTAQLVAGLKATQDQLRSSLKIMNTQRQQIDTQRQQISTLNARIARKDARIARLQQQIRDLQRSR